MPLDVDRIKAICFDVDGTLSDTDDQWVARFERFFTPFRKVLFGYHPHQAARMVVMGMETPGNMMYHFLDILHIDGPFARLYSFLAQRLKFGQRKQFMIVNGTHAMLETMKPHFPMSVVSARDENSTLAFLEQFEITGHFYSVATSQTCRYTKPFPDPILKVAEDMGVKPEECLMIGDTTVDIRAGRAAGAQTLGVLCGFGTEDELIRAGADLILPTPIDVLAHLGLVQAVPVDEFEDLKNFLGGEFHQDMESPEIALQNFFERESIEWLIVISDEIDRFLHSKYSDVEKSKFIEFWTYIYFPYYEVTPLDWLRSVQEKMNKFV